MLYRIFALLFIALCLSSCGQLKKFERAQSTGYTQIKLSPANPQSSIGAMVWAGAGIMVYAVNVDDPNRRGARLMPNESTPVGWAIPNGRYRFLAVGYDMLSANTIKCGINNTVYNLTGSAITIPINISSADCADTVNFQVSGSFSGNQPNPIGLVSCTSATGPLSNGTFLGLAAGGDCLSSYAGGFHSFRISIPEFMAFDGVVHPNQKGAEIQSACQDDGATAGSPVVFSFKFPFGGTDPNSPFLYGVTAYTDSTCSSNSGKRVYGFTHGFHGANNSNTLFFDTSSGIDIPIAPTNTPAISAASGATTRIYLRDLP